MLPASTEKFHFAMTDLHSDLEAETALAGQWFDHLRRHSKSRLGVTRASYGEGEQMAHDLMQADRPDAGAGEADRCRRQSLPDLAGPRPFAARDHDRLASRFGARGRQLRRRRGRGRRHGDAGALAPRRAAAAQRHHGDGRARRGAVVVSRALYRQPRRLRPARARGARRCRRPDTGRTLGAAHGGSGLRARAHPRRARTQLDPATDPLLLRAAYRAGAGAGAEARCRSASSPASAATCAIATATSSAATAMPAPSRASRGRTRVLAGVEFVPPAGGAVDRARERPARTWSRPSGSFHTDTAVHTMTKIPGEVWFSMDIRSEDNDVLLAIDRELRASPRRSARGAACHRPRRLHQCAARPDRQGPSRAPRAAGEDARHPGAVDGERRGPRLGGVRHTCGVPTAMIFVRNEHGSHNPDEAMELADFAQGLGCGRGGGRDRWARHG